MRSAMPIALSLSRARRRTESDGLIGSRFRPLGSSRIGTLPLDPGQEAGIPFMLCPRHDRGCSVRAALDEKRPYVERPGWQGSFCVIYPRTVQSYVRPVWRGSLTAGHDEIRDAD